MRNYTIGFLLLAVMAGLSACRKEIVSSSNAAQPQAAAKYRCPMHPQQIAKRPGDCPICNMNLVLIQADSGEAAGAGPSDCCAQRANTKNMAADRLPVRIASEAQQRIGLCMAKIEARELVECIQATASVQPDETRLAKIVARSAGWVLSVNANFVGQAVSKGEPLLTVYSPELLAIQNDYYLACQGFNACQKQKDQVMAEQREAIKRRMETARRKLGYWQVGEEEIAALEKGAPKEELLLRSPVSGYVTAREAFVGTTFQAGTTLYEVADLSRVWLRASIAEYDLSHIRLGQKARVTFPALGHQSRESSVAFIAPRIDPQTRRAEVRLEMDNPMGDLRANMWAHLELEVSLGKVLAAPASAVLDTGRRTLVFVQRPNGWLEPRAVKVGVKTEEYWELAEGVREGDQVVTRALFLVDSESQLKAAIAAMSSQENEAKPSATCASQPVSAGATVLSAKANQDKP